MKYETRPKRPVHYFGASRILPAIEKNVLRSHFKVIRTQHRSIQLNDTFRNIFCEILGRRYEDAEITRSDKYTLRSCHYGSTYTSFNMGAGEDTLIELLYYLQEAPTGSLIVIEEIELGLHPEAQQKFAKQLQEIIFSKKFQVIVSSHSRAFINSVPRISRVLIQRLNSTTHKVIEAPTTRFAMGYLQGNTLAELIIYCEDKFEYSFAERMIETVLSPELKRRVNVIGVGDNNQVATQCGAHVKSTLPEKYLGVFDGDVSRDDMKKYMKKEIPNSDDGYYGNCFRLTDELLVPEKWVLTEIMNDDDRLEKMCEELEEDSDTAMSYLRACLKIQFDYTIGIVLTYLDQKTVTLNRQMSKV